MYDLTPFKNASNLGDFFIAINNATDGTFFSLSMIAIFLIMLFISKKYEFKYGLIVSGFICFLLSTILVYGKVLNVLFPLAFLLMTGFSALYIWMNPE